MAFELLRTDYVDAVFEGLRRYLVNENGDGSVSFHDVTNYTVREGAFFGAKDANAINTAANAIMAALNNGTDLYEVFTQFFAEQKELFKDESTAKQEEFAAYIAELRTYMSGKWDELKTEYTGDIQYFKDVQENAFNVWFQMIRDQLTSDVAGHLQGQIGNLTELETEEKGSLTGAVNEVNGVAEHLQQQIANLTELEAEGKDSLTGAVNEVNAKVEDIRILYAKATIYDKYLGDVSKENLCYRIKISTINGKSYKEYEMKEGDILIVSFPQPGIWLPETLVRPCVVEFELSEQYYLYNIDGNSQEEPKLVYMNLYYMRTLFLCVKKAYIKKDTLVFTLLNSPLYNASSDYRTLPDNADRPFSVKGANELYQPIRNSLYYFGSGVFTADTITINMQTRHTYLLITKELNASTGAVYGVHARLYNTPNNLNAVPTATVLGASTNAGVTFGTVNKDDIYGITLKASATYQVWYVLYYVLPICR